MGDISTKFLFTRPLGWGKTSFLNMTREFLSMTINKSNGKEIELLDFGDFNDLKIVSEDRVSIEDIEFLFKNYRGAHSLYPK